MMTNELLNMLVNESRANAERELRRFKKYLRQLEAHASNIGGVPPICLQNFTRILANKWEKLEKSKTHYREMWRERNKRQA